jgi:hypothetical protein
MLKREWGNEKAMIREELERLPEKIEIAKANFEKAKADNIEAKKVAALEELPFDNKRLHAEITRVVANLKKGSNSEISIGAVGGFNVSVKAVEEVRSNFSLLDTTTELAAKIVVRGEAEYSCEAGRGEHDNNVVRLKNVFASIIPKREETFANEVTRLTENFEQAKLQVDVPCEYDEKIIELEKELEVLDARLSGIKQQEDVIADDDDLDVSKSGKPAKSEKSEKPVSENLEREKELQADNAQKSDTPDNNDGEIPRRGRVA